MLRVTHADARLRRAARGDAPRSGEGEVEFLVLLALIKEKTPATWNLQPLEKCGDMHQSLQLICRSPFFREESRRQE